MKAIVATGMMVVWAWGASAMEVTLGAFGFATAGEVSVPVRIKVSGEDVGAVEIAVNYDASALRYIGFHAGPVAAAFEAGFTVADNATGTLLVVGAGGDDAPALTVADGVLVELVFRKRVGVTGGLAAFSVGTVTATDATGLRSYDTTARLGAGTISACDGWVLRLEEIADAPDGEVEFVDERGTALNLGERQRAFFASVAPDGMAGRIKLAGGAEALTACEVLRIGPSSVSGAEMHFKKPSIRIVDFNLAARRIWVQVFPADGARFAVKDAAVEMRSALLVLGAGTLTALKNDPVTLPVMVEDYRDYQAQGLGALTFAFEGDDRQQFFKVRVNMEK